MNQQKLLEWALRIAVFGEFLGHGVFAIQGKQAWVGWISQVTGADTALSTQLLLCVGIVDIAVGSIVLLRPIRLVLLWATFCGFATALLRPLMGESVWEFVARWTNWGAPLALLVLRGLPKRASEWFR
ncbi:MAG: hypothetical protein Q7S89_02170 [bacterium]|nr:hypothetical protein [bacterium]